MFPRHTSEAGHLSFRFLEEIIQQRYNRCFCGICKPPFSLHTHFHFSFVHCVCWEWIGILRVAVSAQINNKFCSTLWQREAGGEYRSWVNDVLKLKRSGGNTAASKKWWLEMHLSSRVGYFKYRELIVSDLRISLQVGHSCATHDGVVKDWEQACECIWRVELGFRSTFFSLEAGNLIAWLFWRTWTGTAGWRGGTKLSLTLFYSWKCWNVSISSQYGMENCFSTWTYSWNGNKWFPTHFYSWFFIPSIYSHGFQIMKSEVQTPLNSGPPRRCLAWLLMGEWRWRAAAL